MIRTWPLGRQKQTLRSRPWEPFSASDIKGVAGGGAADASLKGPRHVLIQSRSWEQLSSRLEGGCPREELEGGHPCPLQTPLHLPLGAVGGQVGTVLSVLCGGATGLHLGVMQGPSGASTVLRTGRVAT